MDLNAPVGMDPPRKPRRGRVWIGGAVAAAIGLCAVGAYLASADPGTREAFVVAAIPPRVLEKPPKSQPTAPLPTMPADPGPADSMPTGSVARPASRADMSSGEAATMEHGVKVVRAAPPNGREALDAQGPLIIDVTRSLDGPRHAAKPLPLNQPVPSNEPASLGETAPGDRGPRIAIFVEGMGLSGAATRTAVDSMPAAVDLAFVPYGATIAASVASAKAKGHEVLLQLPMENGQGVSLGPHMLRPDEPAASLADDMSWLTGQFPGYAGVTNLLGAPVTANSPVMTAVLKAVGARGLFFVDDGTSRRSLAPALAASLGVPALRADIVLDATSDKDKVRANLESLVAIAKRKGFAVGMASGLPDHLGAIAKFAGDLGGQGVTLVPLSALVGGTVTTTTTR